MADRIKLKPRAFEMQLLQDAEDDIDQLMFNAPDNYKRVYQKDKDLLATKAEKKWGGLAKKRKQGKRFGHEPSLYDPRVHPRQIYRMKLLGLSDKRVSEILNIDNRTLYNWRIRYVSVAEAYRAGTTGADGVVANSLFKKAVGYQHEIEKVSFDKEGNARRTTVTEKFAPDSTSAIFWLTNRQPDLWKSKKTTENTGPGGSAMPTPVINVFPVLAQTAKSPQIDYDAIDAADADEEARVKRIGQEITLEDEVEDDE